MLKLLFLISVFYSLIRSRVFRSLFSMAEGGCEKFPDHWNPEFFWTIIVEYISHGCPVDILVKRWVIVRISLFSYFPLVISFSPPFELNDLTFNTFHFSFSGSSYLMSPENWLWNLSCLPTQTLPIHVDVPQ